MKSSVASGTFQLYDPTLVPAAGAVVGTAQAEAGARFHMQNKWLPAGTPASPTYVQANLLRTPSVPFVLDYVAVTFLMNLSVSDAGPGHPPAGEISFSVGIGGYELIGPVVLDCTTGVSGVGFSGSVYDLSLSGHRPIFSSVVDPGVALTPAFRTTATGLGILCGNDAGGASPILHVHGGAWLNQPIWLKILTAGGSTTWFVYDGSLVLDVLGTALGTE